MDIIASQYQARATKSEQLKNLSMKIQEVTSNVAITEKNEKQCVKQTIQLHIQAPKQHFQIKLPQIMMVSQMNQ